MSINLSLFEDQSGLIVCQYKNGVYIDIVSERYDDVGFFARVPLILQSLLLLVILMEMFKTVSRVNVRNPY